MKIVRKKIIMIFYIVQMCLLSSSCKVNVDWLGLFRSKTTVEERFQTRMALYEKLQVKEDNLNHKIKIFGNKLKFDFTVVSDIHVADQKASHLRQFLKKRIKTGDQFILDCGDSTQSGNKREVDTYRKLMDRSGKPWFNIPGNHDLYFDGWEHYKSNYGPSVYTIKIGVENIPGSMLVIALDTGNATLGVSQLRWLRQTLDREAHRWNHLVVMTHCQFFSPKLSIPVQFSNSREIYMLMGLFSRYDVDLVLMGHSHHWDERNFNGVPYVNLDAMKNPGSSYLRVSVDGKELSYKRNSY